MRYLHAVALGTWLIGATLPALAVDTASSSDAPDLTAIRSEIDAKDYGAAIAGLNGLIDQGVKHPDVYNLLGYSLRKSGDRKTALTFYQKALEFDPDHKGALEYLGELYVEMGDMGKARENAARLEKLCPQGCEELSELKAAIAQAPAATN
jgi:Flp pilus assembly protein TadD